MPFIQPIRCLPIRWICAPTSQVKKKSGANQSLSSLHSFERR